MSTEAGYLDQGVDYLGFLNAKLRDLRGLNTLINELVQNADDADDATKLIVDITDEALVIENDGQFKDCGSVTARDCSWGSRLCDFHAFRRVASGHKRHERNTTGAFGLGFISVYQVTDRPRLESGQWTWDLDPGEIESQRIWATPRTTPLTATRFTLPWARVKTSVRDRLAQPVVTQADVEQLPPVCVKALRDAAPFLRRLEKLELRMSGTATALVTCDRDRMSEDLLVDTGESAQLWRRCTGLFDDDAVAMRARYGSSIEDKRSSEVTVLIPHGDLPADGLLYAFLPTEQRIAIPILINADFFPSSDRKRILFDGDYQGQWNAAAMRAAARALASGLVGLRGILTPSDLWRVIETTRLLHRESVEARVPAPFAAFWAELEPIIRSNPFVFTSVRHFELPSAARLLQKPEEEEPALSSLVELDLQVAHPDLREYWNALRACGVRELTVEDVIEAMHAQGLSGAKAADQSPHYLRDPAMLGSLIEEILRLLARVPAGKRAQAAASVRELSLCPTTNGYLAPISQTRRPDPEAQELFSEMPETFWLAEGSPEALFSEVKTFTTGDIAGWLASYSGINDALPTEPQLAVAFRVLSWILTRVTEWTSDQRFRAVLSAAPIWPCSGQLKPLAQLYVPGGFRDPLSLASLVDESVVAKWRRELTEILGARVLELDVYLKFLVPDKFATAKGVPNDTRRKLVALITEHLGDLQDRNDVARALATCPIVECRDGQFRPGHEVYFDDSLVVAVLGDRIPIAVSNPSRPEAHRSALTWLGVASRPRSMAIVARVKELAAGAVGTDSRAAVLQVLRGLSAEWNHYSQREALRELRALAWLPARGSDEWHRPSEVFAVYREQVFSSVGPFLDVGRDIQATQSGAKLLEYLGVPSEPSTTMVVRHLRNLVAAGEQPHLDVYRFLSETKDLQALEPLKMIPCLWSGSRYHHPKTVFLESHSFGTRRYTLDSDWLRYAPLLQALDVKRTPDADDARAVLLEIAGDHSNNQPLDEPDFLVVFSSWQVISDALETIADDWFKDLAAAPVVPNAIRILTKPTWLFFRDRPRLAEPFGALLAHNVIDRPSGAAPAMTRVGVRPLSSAVEIDLAECDDPLPATDIQAVLRDRLPLVRRVLETSGLSRLSEDVFAAPSVYWAARLEVVYRVFLGNRHFTSPDPQSVSAYLDRSDGRLYVARQTKAWQTVVARELAFAAIPEASAAHLAAVVEIILAAEDLTDAAARLDDLGFAPADVQIQAPIPAPPLVAPDEIPSDAPISRAPTTESQPGEDTEQASPQPSQRSETDGAAGGSSGGPFSVPGATPYSPGKPTARAGSPSGGALRSYVVTHNQEQRKRLLDETMAKRSEADQAGIARALLHETAAGRFPEEKDHRHEGYDIESRNALGELERLIEVKGVSGKWSGMGVKLSPPQFRCAQDKGDEFWLYVVEFAGKPDETIYCIQNPARRVDEFRFDDGWAQAAAPDKPQRLHSILDIPNPERDGAPPS